MAEHGFDDVERGKTAAKGVAAMGAELNQHMPARDVFQALLAGACAFGTENYGNHLTAAWLRIVADQIDGHGNRH